MWRSRRWRYLLNRIDGLPRNSAYGEALADDEEIAEQILDRPETVKAPAVRVRDYSPELEALITIQDRLGDVVQAVIAATGSKPPKIKPQPRPVTAVERIREKHRFKQHRRTLSLVMIEQPDGSTRSLADIKPAPLPALPPMQF